MFFGVKHKRKDIIHPDFVLARDGHMTKQMKHACSWNIQTCCPSVEMSSLGLHPRDDMSTSGQHI